MKSMFFIMALVAFCVLLTVIAIAVIRINGFFRDEDLNNK